MIPRVLQIKNFLSYSAQVQTIDFTAYSLICLSGKNGHGKSALLDSITWALWGHARKAQGIGKPDEGLIRMGQNNVFVSFEFQVGSSIYRVRREFFKGSSRPVSSLEFQIFDSQANEFKTLTDKTIGLTQEKIEKCLGLDFDTFLNTSFFSQGRSNEFSKKTPKERKQILAGIIGLEKYDKMSSKAQEIVRAKQDEMSKVVALQEISRREVLRLPELEERFLLGNTKLEELKKQTLDLEQKKTVLSQEIEGINSVLALKVEIARKKTDLLVLCSKWRNIHRELVCAPNLVELNNERDALQKRRQLLIEEQLGQAESSKQCFELKNRLFELENAFTSRFRQDKDLSFQAIQAKRFEHKNFEKELEQALNRKKIVKDKLNFSEKKIEQLRLELAAFTTTDQKFEDLKQKNAKVLRFKEFVFQKARSNREDLAACQENLRQILLSPEDASCPTCGQGLSCALSAKMVDRLSAKNCFLKTHLLHLKKAFDLITSRLENFDEQIKDFENKTTEGQSIRAKLESSQLESAAFEKEIEIIKTDVDAVISKISESAENLESLERDFQANFDDKVLISQISADPEVSFLRSNYLKLLGNLERAENCQKTLEKTYSEIEILEARVLQASEIDSERRAQTVRRENIEFLYRDSRDNSKKIGLKIESAEKRLSELLIFRDQLSAEQASLELKIQELLQEIGSCRQELSRVKALSDDLKEIDLAVANLKEEADDFAQLSGAFGKNGIQALIIEGLIPEIESQANLIMANLSEDQARIFIEPLKDLKKGGYKESLDIKISDSSGVRPYEMFSGGEAFRIDFALRISISKLLAKIAGANLQTLIIDEGFGSQDQEGISRLMEAISSVRNDFSKIIVVSHLQELKNEFPVHFLVTKTSTGSMIKVEYRG